MKITVVHSSDFDFKNKLYRPVQNILGDKHKLFLPQEADQEILTETILRNSDLVLAEVSCPSTGMGIELGMARMMHKPIILMYEHGAKISQALRLVVDRNLFFSYADEAEMREVLQAKVERVERELLSSP